MEQPLGAHLSIIGWFNKVVKDAESIGCTALQVFLHSNRQWAMKSLTAEQIKEYKAVIPSSPITYVLVHASYLINLGSHEKNIRSRSLEMLKKEVNQCQELGIPYLVLHPGNATGTTTQESLELIAQGINETLSTLPGKTAILIENMAGQGKVCGSSLEELHIILQAIENKKRTGICFDTCHGFAAGYNFTQPKEYNSFWKLFDETIGLHFLKAFHLNDSKKELGSRVDRHEQIGKGKIGIEAFRLIMNDDRFKELPKILETPYENYAKDALRLYAHNIALLRSLVK